MSDSRVRGEGGFARAEREGIVCFLDALPAVITIHRVVPPGNGGDLSSADLAHCRFQRVQKALGRGGRGVAPVEKGVNEDARHATRFRQFQEGE